MTTSLSDLLEIRLFDWADWFGKNDQGLGYPKETLEYKLWRDGVIVRVKGIKPEPENYAAEEMEMWLCLMRKYVGADVADAIISKYLAPRFMSPAKIAEKLGTSVRTYEYRINYAKKFLLGCLAGYNLKKEEKAA